MRSTSNQRKIMTDYELSKAIGKRIKSLRKDTRLTQSKMAVRLDMTTNTYERIERGITVLSVPRLMKIADVLNVNVSEILNAVPNSSVIATLEGGGV
jgi:transcriptional regulator with XRE-family HTH domain